MKYAIISDIHSNLNAFEHVLKRIEEIECDKIICLGDIVGYGPFPNECCNLVQKQSEFCIMGNHDHAAIGLTSTTYFNQYARTAIEWTSAELNDGNLEFLRHLPVQEEIENLLFVHATPRKPLEWNYIFSLYEAHRNFEHFEQHACFIGHSHVPAIFMHEEGEIPSLEQTEKIWLVSNARYIINVGSVGQPRDNDPRASFGVFDTDTGLFELERVNYDVQKTQKAMSEKNLPLYLIERIAHGR